MLTMRQDQLLTYMAIREGWTSADGAFERCARTLNALERMGYVRVDRWPSGQACSACITNLGLAALRWGTARLHVTIGRAA